MIGDQRGVGGRPRAARAREGADRRSDELARQRRELPWVAVEEDYEFEGPDGSHGLADLFAEPLQLLVYHLMFGPDDEAGVAAAHSAADSLAGAVVHLENAGVSFVAVSRAPLERLFAYRRAHGLELPVGVLPGPFNQDFAGYGGFR